MTAQIGDIYRYQDKKYSLVALSEGEPFQPRMYGMESHPSSTGCYRGYWCEYAIIEKQLILKELYLFNKDGNYPPLNGIEVSPQEFEEYERWNGNSEKREKVNRPTHFGHRVYRNVNMPIPYTGKILLGDGFMREYYIHMGFQRGWAYKELLELVFEEGELAGSNDFSHYAKAQRQVMRQREINPRYPDGGNILQFVEDSFSLEYPAKVWWLK